jgi:hypothetical protein
MDEILERLKEQSKFPKMGAYNHDVCIVRQDDLKAIITVFEDQLKELEGWRNEFLF